LSPLILWDQHIDEVLTEGLFTRPSEFAFGLIVPIGDARTLIKLDEDLMCGIENGTRALFICA
jgi:hypothetical protein